MPKVTAIKAKRNYNRAGPVVIKLNDSTRAALVRRMRPGETPAQAIARLCRK